MCALLNFTVTHFSDPILCELKDIANNTFHVPGIIKVGASGRDTTPRLNVVD